MLAQDAVLFSTGSKVFFDDLLTIVSLKTNRRRN
jgi:hypothetical protein